MIALTTTENLPARIRSDMIHAMVENAEYGVKGVGTTPKYTLLKLNDNTSLSVINTIEEIEAKIKEEQGE